MKPAIAALISFALLLASCGKKEDIELSPENWLACATAATRYIESHLGGHEPKFDLDTNHIFIKPITDSNFVSVSGSFEATEELGKGIPTHAHFEVPMQRKNGQWEVEDVVQVSITVGGKAIRKGY